MPNSNGIITAPVSFADVNAVLGTSYTDLGMMCGSSYINMWARFKPVRLSSKMTSSEWDATNNKWKTTSTWWKGGYGDMCGITPPSYSNSLETALAAYGRIDNGWVYNAPNGTEAQPYRLTDFACYNHNAPAPISRFLVPSRIVRDGSFTASALKTAWVDGTLIDSVTIRDLINNNFPNVYFGVAFCRIVNNAITVYAKCTSQQSYATIVQGDFSNAPKLTLGTTYRVYPFFSNQAISLTDTVEPADRKYIACPNLAYAETEIVSTAASITLTAKWIMSRIFIDAKNNDATSYPNCCVYIIRYTQQSWDDPDSYTYNADYTSGTFTLAANSTSTFIATGLYSSVQYFVYGVFNTTTKLKSLILRPSSDLELG